MGTQNVEELRNVLIGETAKKILKKQASFGKTAPAWTPVCM
jgi:hypothetical protein